VIVTANVDGAEVSLDGRRVRDEPDPDTHPHDRRAAARQVHRDSPRLSSLYNLGDHARRRGGHVRDPGHSRMRGCRGLSLTRRARSTAPAGFLSLWHARNARRASRVSGRRACRRARGLRARAAGLRRPGLHAGDPALRGARRRRDAEAHVARADPRVAEVPRRELPVRARRAPGRRTVRAAPAPGTRATRTRPRSPRRCARSSPGRARASRARATTRTRPHALRRCTRTKSRRRLRASSASGLARLRDLASREVVVTENSRVVAALPFGIGSFRTGTPVSG